MRPRVVYSRAEFLAARAELGGRVGVVLTMGALHAGHAALLAAARARRATGWSRPSSSTRCSSDRGEDLARYPRTLDADLALCAEPTAPTWSGRRPSPTSTRTATPQVTVGAGAARRGPGGRRPARPLRRRAHRGRQVLRTHPARRRPASARRTTSSSTLIRRMVRRPRVRRGRRRRAHRARAGRAGAVQPQRLPVGRGPRRGARRCPARCSPGAGAAAARCRRGARRGRRACWPPSRPSSSTTSNCAAPTSARSPTHGPARLLVAAQVGAHPADRQRGGASCDRTAGAGWPRPRPGWADRGRRRRRRLGHRRPDRRAATSAGQRAARPARHQGRARRRLDPLGAGRHRRRARRRRLARAALPATRWSRAPACATRPRCGCSSREGPAAVRELVAASAPRFDRAADGELVADPRGRPPPRPHRARRRRRDRRGDRSARWSRRAARRRRHRGDRARAGPRPAAPTPTARVAGLTLHVMGEGQRDGVGAVRARAVVLATGGIGQVYASTTNPSVSTGDGVAAALRAGCGACATWSSSSSTRPSPGSGHGPARPAAAGQRGGARRGRVPGRRRRRALHARASTNWPTSRRATSSPRRSCAACARPAPNTCGWTRGSSARRSGGSASRPSTPRCSTLGIDPVTELIPVVPACHYASGGVRTDLLRRVDVAGPVRLRRVGLHRRARREPAGLQLPARGTGVRSPDRRRHRRPTRRAGGRSRPVAGGRAARTLLDGRQRAGPAAADVARRRRAARPSGPRGRRGRPRRARQPRAAAPATENWETTNLLTVASALVQAAALREETRGSHWREDFPERDDAHWLGHLDTVQTPDGTLLTDFAPLGVAAGGREQRAAGQSRAGQPG